MNEEIKSNNSIRIFSFQGKDNAKASVEVEKDRECVLISSEIFQCKDNDHKFKLGQEVRLTGLEDYSEFNGELVVITSIRVNGTYGKAYYFKTDNPDLASQLNWTYEYRLEENKR